MNYNQETFASGILCDGAKRHMLRVRHQEVLYFKHAATHK